jgi:hypothetical protein
MLRRVFSITIVAAGLFATQARADEACSKAYDGALALSDAPERDPTGLHAASKQCLEACAKSAADQSTLTECESWKTKARDFLAFATFDIRDDAGGLVTDGTVSIDGAPPRALPRDPLELNPGAHTFKIEVKVASGPVTSTASESFNSKESKAVKFSLKPQTPAVLDPGGGPKQEQGGGLPAWAFVVGGIGIGAAVAGSVLLGVGASVSSNPDDAPVCDVFSDSYDPIACNDLADDPPSGTAPLAAGAVLLVLGTGGLIAGIVGLATAPKGKAKAAAIEFVPVVGPGVAFGSMRGSF